jgi:hypothetical protein
MKNSVQKVAIGGLVATLVLAVVMVGQLVGQQDTVTGDFRNAATAEIRDPQGQVLLRGSFAPVDADDAGEIERLATLTTTVAGSAAAGEAEVEYQKDTPAKQEVEFKVSGVPAGAVLTLVIDGKAVLTATADKKGNAEAEAGVTAGQPGGTR